MMWLNSNYVYFIPLSFCNTTVFKSICLSLIYVLYICLSIFVYLDVLIVFVACSILPCKYPATCVDGATTDEYTCVCTEGYSGTNCDTVTGM